MTTRPSVAASADSVLIDTPIWSLALRRNQAGLSAIQQQVRETLDGLITDKRAQLIGPVRQELLSGVKEMAQFKRLREHLRGFQDVQLASEDYEEAALISNLCRAAGIAGSPTDCLICSVALRRDWQVLTLDRDFVGYARVCKVRLHSL